MISFAAFVDIIGFLLLNIHVKISPSLFLALSISLFLSHSGDFCKRFAVFVPKLCQNKEFCIFYTKQEVLRR